ncbi:MAG: type IV pilus modification PilV family protein [Planctomycetota bacterium]|jgi:prepilin-type N-terminal cleavage/methylation domain-containing protein
MRKSRKNNGFSLTEVLLSVGILSVGMIFIAGVFPVGIHFATIATERTIKIYATGNPSKPIDFSALKEKELAYDFNDIFPAMSDIDPNLNLNEFAYPSSDTGSQKQYYWSALCRRDGSDPNRLVQVTVFVSRRTRVGLKYHEEDGGENGARPVPVPVGVSQGSNDNELEIVDYDQWSFINDDYTIVDNQTGDIYRVLERYRPPKDDTILLDRDWDYDGDPPDEVWVIPPPVNGGRYPCIAIYQKVIRF